MRASFGFVPLILLVSSLAALAADKPKYGPEATRLSLSHAYFQSHAAPDYWAISPYYVGQRDEKSCSLASVTMIVNAARVQKNLTAEDELATQPQVLKKTGDARWEHDLGTLGRGVTLDELGKFTEEALKAYGVAPKKVEVLHASTTPEFRQALLEILTENEKSSRDFVIANFIQGAYTGDADVGHISPIGAFDAKNERVLVLDPDRQWYEPYWVSLTTFIRGMSTQDSVSGKTRGLVWIQLP